MPNQPSSALTSPVYPETRIIIFGNRHVISFVLSKKQRVHATVKQSNCDDRPWVADGTQIALLK